MTKSSTFSRIHTGRVVKTNPHTPAGKYNAMVKQSLIKAFGRDPEVDFTRVLGSKYSAKLKTFQTSSKSTVAAVATRDYDFRSALDPAEQAAILGALSPHLEKKLGDQNNLPEAVINLLRKADVLFEGPTVTVLEVDEMAVKITLSDSTITEYGSLSYLEKNLTHFPAPRPHGLVKMGIYYILFTAFVPGITLERAWPQLSVTGKDVVRNQLNNLLSSLRALPFPQGTPLGGVLGEGCIDRRRGIRINTEPIMDTAQFADFIFAGSKTASPVYAKLLRELMPVDTPCVFTHGDIRPANIMVEINDGGCNIQGIIDWEASGFYPEYWESVKATNNMMARETPDWYEYLPDLASPSMNKVPWLLDRLWDRSMDNS